MNFISSHTNAKHWEEAVSSCLRQMAHFTPSANLGFLYVTDWFANSIHDITDYLKQNTPVNHWVGAIGVGICSQNVEYFDEPAMAIMLGQLPENSFQIFTNMKDEQVEKFTFTHQSWCESKQPMFAIVHGDPRHSQIVDTIFQLSEQLGEGFLVGGLTSSRHQHFQLADEIVEGGFSGVLFSSVIKVATRLTQGCSAIGPRRQITQANHNIIVRIDDRPALDVFKEDIGKELSQDLEKIAGNIFAALPIIGSDTGDYVVRNLIGIDPEHQLLAIGDVVKPGMPILFTRRDAKTAYEDLITMLKKLKNCLNDKPPKGGVYYSCLGRGESLFGKHKEIQVIHEILGEFPLVGFFASGEIFYQRLYSYTGVLTLFLNET
jgi:small ligand-binding sensory domain FIST